DDGWLSSAEDPLAVAEHGSDVPTIGVDQAPSPVPPTALDGPGADDSARSAEARPAAAARRRAKDRPPSDDGWLTSAEDLPAVGEHRGDASTTGVDQAPSTGPSTALDGLGADDSARSAEARSAEARPAAAAHRDAAAAGHDDRASSGSRAGSDRLGTG